MGRYTVDARAVDRLKEAAAGNGVCMKGMYNHCKA